LRVINSILLNSHSALHPWSYVSHVSKLQASSEVRQFGSVRPLLITQQPSKGILIYLPEENIVNKLVPQEVRPSMRSGLHLLARSSWTDEEHRSPLLCSILSH